MRKFFQRLVKEQMSRKTLGFANKISITRILLIPFLVSAMFYCTQSRPFMRWVVAGIFCVAMLTDFIDGLVARAFKQKTRIGMILDPLADNLLLLNAFIWMYHLKDTLPFIHKIPVWVILIVVSRDLIILLGVVVFYFLELEVSIVPTVWGKLTTFFQMAAILGVMLDVFFAPALLLAACIITFISGGDYVMRGVGALGAVDNKNHAG